MFSSTDNASNYSAQDHDSSRHMLGYICICNKSVTDTYYTYMRTAYIACAEAQAYRGMQCTKVIIKWEMMNPIFQLELMGAIWSALYMHN